MPQPIDEHRFEMGLYVIGVFDVLGQKRRLYKPVPFPTTSEDDVQEIGRALGETVVPVDDFRQRFQRQLTEREQAFDEDAATIPKAERDEYIAALAPSIVSWGFSDTYCVAIPLERGSGHAGAMRVMANVRRLLEVTALSWLASLAENHPIRGGIEIGPATRMRGNDVYGLALAEAHRIESEDAGHPRIVLGGQLVKTLRTFRKSDYVGAAALARDCCSMLKAEMVDGRAQVELNVLGGSWATLERRRRLRKVFETAYDNVRHQLKVHTAADATKLTSRYEVLLRYFDNHAKRWRNSDQ